MSRHVLLVVLIVVAFVVVSDAVRRAQPPLVTHARHAPAARKSGVAPPLAPPLASSGPGLAATSGTRTLPRVRLLATQAPVVGTPTLDMLNRLAVRRRIAREGRRIYLDSMFAATDSVVIRWNDHPVVHVFLVRDTALAGWKPLLLDEARAAMKAWSGNPSGLAFVEVGSADSADVRVRWTAMLTDSGEVGNTSVNWGSNGVITGATVTLALRHSPDSLVLPVALRRRVAAHEFGHVLGLPNSDDTRDLMFRSAPVGVPSVRDQQTLRLLYAVPPGNLHVVIPGAGDR